MLHAPRKTGNFQGFLARYKSFIYNLVPDHESRAPAQPSKREIICTFPRLSEKLVCIVPVLLGRNLSQVLDMVELSLVL
jgi:hypothetical protein